MNNVRLRIGYKVPIFSNAGIVVIHVSRDAATKLTEGFATFRALLMAYAPQIAANLVCEAS